MHYGCLTPLSTSFQLQLDTCWCQYIFSGRNWST